MNENKKLKLIYEIKGNFTPLLMDFIINNYVKDVDLIAIINKEKLSFFVDSNALENVFLKNTINHLLDSNVFNLFSENIKTAKEELERSHDMINGNETNIQNLLNFFENFENFLKYYNVIDFNISSENENRIKERGDIIYENYKQIGSIRNNLREFVNNFVFLENSRFKRVIKLTCDLFKIDEEEIHFYKRDELLDINKQKISSLEINQRKEIFIIEISSNKINYYTGNNGEEYISKLNLFQHNSEDDSNTIKGNVIFYNEKNLNGFVKIFPSVDFSKINSQIQELTNEIDLNKDIILVTEISTPEMIPLFDKVKAVIVDFGGTLSHAAIVCREMQIPCIVGTKAATKRFKNGDEIAINFENGVIKLNNLKSI